MTRSLPVLPDPWNIRIRQSFPRIQPVLDMCTIKDKARKKGTLTIGVHFQDGFLGLDGRKTHI